jgi:hypothetical protein
MEKSPRSTATAGMGSPADVPTITLDYPITGAIIELNGREKEPVSRILLRFQKADLRG